MGAWPGRGGLRPAQPAGDGVHQLAGELVTARRVGRELEELVPIEEEGLDLALAVRLGAIPAQRVERGRERLRQRRRDAGLASALA
jgi:hypothetical protein